MEKETLHTLNKHHHHIGARNTALYRQDSTPLIKQMNSNNRLDPIVKSRILSSFLVAVRIKKKISNK